MATVEAPVLEVSGLCVRFGGLVALEDVSLSVSAGELVGLIGPNGAGKTTLIDAVTGFARYEGSVSVSGERLDGARPDQRAARGLARTFQSLELFEDLTVRENVLVSAGDSPTAVAAALAATELTQSGDQLPASLPPSTRRLVALARAIAARPRVLLLDEVAAGLDRSERLALTSRLRGIASDGCGVLLVDHDIGLVTELCERVIVLDAGRVIACGLPADIRRDEQVLTAYLGRRQ
jgi:ABC-type branched-subunit amino acid transport system ATPase component